MNPVIVNAILALTANEIVAPAAGDVNGPAGTIVPHNGFNFYLNNLNAASGAWPVAGCSYQDYTIGGGGTTTVDLTNLVGITSGTVVNGTGKKVRGIILQAAVGNAASIVITPGASNGYNLFGASSSLTIGAGEALVAWKQNNAPTVASGAKTLTLTGTAGDVISIGIVFG